MNLSPCAVQQFFDNNGRPLVGGLLFTYEAGTSTKAETYLDEAGTPNTNPIELDFRGECRLWLDPEKAYKFVLSPRGDTDPPTRPIWTADNITAAATLADITRQLIGRKLWPITPTEVAEGVDPIYYYYAPGDVRRYGASGDGATNDTAAFRSAAAVTEGARLFVPYGAYLIDDEILLKDGVLVDFEPGAIVTTINPGKSIFRAVDKKRVSIRNGVLKYADFDGTAYSAGVRLTNCEDCVVENCAFDGVQWSGVYLEESSYCRVIGNRVVDIQGTAQDSNCVCIHGNASFNTVSDNTLLGGTSGHHGILVQDPSGATLPLHNVLRNNSIGPHAAYGIACYQVSSTVYNQQTVIDGNTINGIEGSAPSGAGGMGIYIQTAGGCVITNNRVSDCCRDTSVFTHAPAAITVAYDNVVGLSVMPVIVANNHVETEHQGGINIANARGSIIGNYIQNTDGTAGSGIRIIDCEDVSVIGNTVSIPDIGRPGIQVFASIRDSKGIVIQGNTISGTQGTCISTDRVGGTTFVHEVTISGNSCMGASGATAMLLGYLQDSVVNGNRCSGNIGIHMTTCAAVRGVGNILRGVTYTLSTSGTNTACVFDLTNDYNLVASTNYMSNSGTGVLVEALYSSAPSGGSWQIGDRIQNSGATVGQPTAWRCTATGPVTWTSEGNL